MDEERFNDEERCYQEVINKKPSGGKKGIIILLLCAFIIGTGFGLGVNQLLAASVGENSSAYAADSLAINQTASTEAGTSAGSNLTASPVVPIAKKVSPSIVAIEITANQTDVFGQRYESSGTGSGIIIDNKGHIVTNNHVVEGASALTVILQDGTKLKANLVGRDATTDLAVIKVDKTGLPAAELGDSAKLAVGELAVAIGSPMGTNFAGSVTAGIISGVNRELALGDKTMNLIQTDAAINPGNSGGALVNEKGQVIGINTVKLAQSSVEGMGFSIPINEAKPIITELIENKKIVRPYLGIQGNTVTEADSQRFGLAQGVYVYQVVPGSGADQAGIESGEVITKIDNQKITTIEQLVGLISNKKAGDKVTVEVTDSNQKTRTVTVILKES
ncbi:S1C family serine protease [Dehalobacterium formicoaceticum]|uniref:Trypsin-like peptidase domain-containing protein n=1 Tax=Dehalobacterium formicoaceticum TaxID=51515 RepID=A0ABT1Y5F2_9FIRM|nr:trypsin-like peptidase domain-containing protein [Dehalobacterium formicoaceticum]MCR6546103.1 trypsin-like peptidase domain-containing protein [Dehalobacterium formicoaceticum]